MSQHGPPVYGHVRLRETDSLATGELAARELESRFPGEATTETAIFLGTTSSSVSNADRSSSISLCGSS